MTDNKLPPSIRELQEEIDSIKQSGEWEYSDLAWNRLRHLQSTVRDLHVQAMIRKEQDE